jgi:hypothetical protein
MSAGESFYVTFGYYMCKPHTIASMAICAEVYCGATLLYHCYVPSKFACTCSGVFGSRLVTYNDSVNNCYSVIVKANAEDPSVCQSLASVYINNIVNNSGNFNLSAQNSSQICTLSNVTPPEV